MRTTTRITAVISIGLALTMPVTGSASCRAQTDAPAPDVLLTISPAAAPGGETADSIPPERASQPPTRPAEGDRRRIIAGKITPPHEKLARKSQELDISINACELAEAWGLLPYLERYCSEPVPRTFEMTEFHMRHMFEKQRLIETVLEYSFDIKRALNQIDREMSTAMHVKAVLAEKRDRAIRLNSYADLVAGGLTGIMSGALRLGGLEFVTPDVIDVVEGVMEGSLAGWAVKSNSGQRKLSQGVPNVLARLIYPDMEKHPEFPDSVWEYLNTIPAGSKSGMSRRETMVDRWECTKYCLIHKGHKARHHERMKRISGVKEDVVLTIDVLEDRIAMLQDLRSEISLMDNYLSEIFSVVRRKSGN